MKTILAPLFAAVLCLALLAGCSSKKTLVGKWQNDAGMQTEFTSDGKLMQTVSGQTMTAAYTVVDDGHYKEEMDLGGTKQSNTVGYTIDGDTLTLDESGVKLAFKRVK